VSPGNLGKAGIGWTPALPASGGEISERSMGKHGRSSPDPDEDISVLRKEEHFLVEKPAGEAAPLGKSHISVKLGRNKPTLLKCLLEQTLFTIVLVLKETVGSCIVIEGVQDRGRGEILQRARQHGWDV
jgi:hypothetical protein